MLQFIKPLSLFLVFVTATGVLVHDMNIDKAAKLALAPAAVAAATAASIMIVKSDHIHVETAASPKKANHYISSLPKVNPPRDDDKRYSQSKKGIVLTGGGQGSLWPSV